VTYGVVLFHTTSAVMRAEKLLLREGYALKLVPTPREFSSDCGMALRFDWELYKEVVEVLARAGVEVQAVHRLA
jgi:hypothetical protein